MSNIPMKNIPTWEELEISDKFDDYGSMARWWVKQHLKAQLKAIDKTISKKWNDDKSIPNIEELKDAYPESNIE